MWFTSYRGHSGGGGVLFPLTWPGENSARRAVCLPSHRLVGELSHPIELLLHLVFSALTPTGGNIPHYFSQYNGPCSTEAQHKIQSSIFPFPHRKFRIPRLHIFKWWNFFFSTSTFAPLPAQGCWTNSPLALTGRERQQWQVAAAQQCSVGNVGNQACCSINNPMLPVPRGLRGVINSLGIYSNARLRLFQCNWLVQIAAVYYNNAISYDVAQCQQRNSTRCADWMWRVALS